MANSRFYSSIAQQTTLTSGITASGTTMIVAATTGFPGSLPYTLAVDYGASNEELVEVTGVAGTTLTVTRSIDGTSGSSHNPGAVIRHVSSARDFTDSRTHEATSTNVHGLSGGAAVVGTTSTQTLTNKTLTHALGSADNFKLFSGSAVTQIIGNSANSGANRLEVLDDETALNTMFIVTNNGGIKSLSRTADTTGTYRARFTDNDGTTDRFAVLAGGTISITPNSTTNFVGVDIIAPDTSTSKRAIRVAASGGGTERFTVWNDGRVDIVGSAASFSTLDVTAPASVSADIMRVLDSGSNTQWGIQSSGKMLANKGATIAQPGVTSGAVLQVGGSNVGYTGNLTQWVSPANAVVANITETGAFSAPSVSTTGDTTVTGNLAVTGIGSMRGARKTADQTVTNSTTQVNDTHLFVSVEANAVYTIDAYIIYNALAAADVNLAFTVPASSSGSWTGFGVGLTQSAQTTDGYTLRTEQNTITQVRGFGGIESAGVAQDITVRVSGLAVISTTPGTLRLQWAQRVANAQGTILRTDSWLRVHRIA